MGWKQFQLYHYVYITMSTSLWLLTLLEFLQFVFANSNVYDEISISKLKPHKACTATAKVQMLYIKEEEEGSILDLDFKTCIRITKETPSKSWVTVRMADDGCHCF